MHAPTPNRTAARVAIFATVLALLVAACTGSDPAGEPSDPTTPASTSGDAANNRGEAADWLGVDLPASAGDFNFASDDEGIDDSALMRFTLPTSEFEPFISSLNMGRELSAGRHGFPAFTDPAWMDTSALTDFVGAPSTGRTPSVQVTADTSLADTVTVYILAFDV